jgi:hypothetical protein
MKRLAIWAAALADRFLATHLDKRVCRLSNELTRPEDET